MIEAQPTATVAADSMFTLQHAGFRADPLRDRGQFPARHHRLQDRRFSLREPGRTGAERIIDRNLIAQRMFLIKGNITKLADRRQRSVTVYRPTHGRLRGCQPGKANQNHHQYKQRQTIDGEIPQGVFYNHQTLRQNQTSAGQAKEPAK